MEATSARTAAAGTSPVARSAGPAACGYRAIAPAVAGPGRAVAVVVAVGEAVGYVVGGVVVPRNSRVVASPQWSDWWLTKRTVSRVPTPLARM